MPVFTIKAPDGKTYKVKGETQEGAIAFLKSQHAQKGPTGAELPPAVEKPADISGTVDKIKNYMFGNPEDMKAGKPPKSVIADTLKAFTRGSQNLLTGGWNDELEAFGRQAGTNLAGKPETYDESLEKIRGDEKQLREESPYAFGAGQVMTGAALPAFGSKAIGNPSLVGNMLRGSAGMGTGGAIYGAGEAEDDKKRGAFVGGLTGMGLGAGIPLLSAGVGAGVTALRNRKVDKMLRDQLGIEPEVGDYLHGQIAADTGMPQATVNQNMLDAGPDAMIADVGPNVQKTLDVSIAQGGAGATEAGKRISARANRGANAIETALTDKLGAPQGAFTSIKKNRLESAAEREAAYGKSYETPIDYASPEGQAIESIVKKRVPGEAITAAKKLMKLEGYDSKQLLAKIDDEGNVTFEKLPDTRQLDYITRGLDEVAENSKGQGAQGGMTNTGRIHANLSKEIRDQLRVANPEYGVALDTAGDVIRKTNAIKLGQQAMGGNMHRDEFADLVSNMEAPEKDALKQSIRGKVDETLANIQTATKHDDLDAKEAVKALRIFSSDAARDKLNILLGPEEAAALTNELDRVSKSFDLRAAVAENSKTAAREMAKESVKAGLGKESIMFKVRRGEPIGTAKRTWQKMTGETDEALMARERQGFTQIADLLTKPASEAFPAFQILNEAGTKRAITAAQAKKIEAMIRKGLGGSLILPTVSAATRK